MASTSKSNLSPDVQARIDFVRSVVPRRKSRPVLSAAIIAAVIVVVSGLIWLIASPGHEAPRPKAHALSTPKAVVLNPSTPSLTYTSKFFGLQLSYPSSWSLKDSGSGLLTVTSPLTSLVAADGTSVPAEVSFIAIKQGTLPSGLTAGTNLAVLESSIVNYSNPSTNQPGQTYISFVQYSTTNTKGGLDGVYLTGNLGYQKDQVIPSSDIASASPLIYASFNSCANKLCKTFEPLTIASSSWSGTSLGQIVSAIIESFVFN